MGFLSEFSRTRAVNDRQGARRGVRFFIDTPEPVSVSVLPVEPSEPVEGMDTPEPTDDAVSDVAAFDPSEHTVAEVLAYLRANPDDRQRVIGLEADGKQRGTILGF